MSMKGETCKIICLIDTDIQSPTFCIDRDVESQILVMRRLHQEAGNEAVIIKGDDNRKNPTEVEEVLEPSLFYNSLKNVILKNGSESEKEIFSCYDFNQGVSNSRIKGDYSIIKPKVLNRDIAADKEVISAFIDAHKDKIAKEYTAFEYTGIIPKWIQQLKELTETEIKK